MLPAKGASPASQAPLPQIGRATAVEAWKPAAESKAAAWPGVRVVESGAREECAPAATEK